MNFTQIDSMKTHTAQQGIMHKTIQLFYYFDTFLDQKGSKGVRTFFWPKAPFNSDSSNNSNDISYSSIAHCLQRKLVHFFRHFGKAPRGFWGGTFPKNMCFTQAIQMIPNLAKLDIMMEIIQFFTILTQSCTAPNNSFYCAFQLLPILAKSLCIHM